MLKHDHILNLKIDRSRLQTHQSIAAMGGNSNVNTIQLEALGNAALGNILGILPGVFKNAYSSARSKKVAYLVESMRGIIGVSPITSVIKDRDIMNKNVIIPSWRLNMDPGLSDHCVVAMFVVGHKNDRGVLEYDPESVQVAGWTDVRRMLVCASGRTPNKFRTKLEVTVMPCRYLEPIDTLVSHLAERKSDDGSTENK